MSTDAGIQMLVLEEFRLRTGDADGTVAAIVRGSRRGREPAIPMLTSLDDPRNVAILRALHPGESPEPDGAQHSALQPFVSSWQTPKHYGPRITERSQSPPAYYRLAVTESGINDTEPVAEHPRSLRDDATSTDVGLLWIGQPLGTYAGLLVLFGGHDDRNGVSARARDWPLPLSRYLGIRIYEGLVTAE